MYKIFLALMLCGSLPTQAQQTITFSISHDGEPIPATIQIANGRGYAVDSTGTVAILFPANGRYKLTITSIGLEEQTLSITIPHATNMIEIELEHDHEDEEPEVVVQSTRLSRTIANIPTRVVVISGEELMEKANMKPGDIRMLLSETTGIQTQQTSATSFNAGIRIQGLEGRYTQLLRDGYPLYSGFSGGLSILQIPPLDLKQVEVIKGSASTLYGGGAIAGLVNLISKTPTQKPELSFYTNATTAGGLDLSTFYSKRYGKSGLTLFASRNSNKAFDPADIGLTAIPEFERYTVNPRFFFYGKKTTADAGITYITEDRTGGSINYIKNGGTGFFEKNNSDRITTQFGIAYRVGEHATLRLKNSYSRFDRIIRIPGYLFDALQQNSFSELTWTRQGKAADWVIGANLLTEDLAERQQAGIPLRDYHYNTLGIFVQNAWTISEKIVLETGLRGDVVDEVGFEILPRMSAMIRITPKLTTRIGGGMGYKTPTIFTEEAERIQFQEILPIDVNAVNNERSVGGNWDINYRTNFGELGFAFNQLFFYTRLNDPLVIVSVPAGLEFRNAQGFIDTRGAETNLRFNYGNFKLFLGYTYTDAHTHYTNVKSWLPLTARHRLNNVLMYEVHDNIKIGLEAYYFSRQKLNDGSLGNSYWITGFMVEKFWERFSVFINFENFTDTRQSKFGSIYTGTLDNPTFKDIYAPVEGFVMNGGIKFFL